MKLILTIALFLMSFLAFSQDIQYKQVGVKIYGYHSAIFSFSYDWRDTCSNNITVINTTADSLTFKYNIIIKKKVIYIGKIKAAPLQSLYFNDAFIRCNQIKEHITIKIIE